MTTDKKVARRKLSMLELTTELGNVSKACKITGRKSSVRFWSTAWSIQATVACGWPRS